MDYIKQAVYTTIRTDIRKFRPSGMQPENQKIGIRYFELPAILIRLGTPPDTINRVTHS